MLQFVTMKLKGKVIKGKKRGKKMGYPTANIKVDEKIAQGIYISEITIDKTNHPSVTFVGNAKTFGESDVFVETYIFDFDRDLYDQHIVVNLIKKIRENVQFEDEKSLVKQIEKDVKIAKEYFKI